MAIFTVNWTKYRAEDSNQLSLTRAVNRMNWELGYYLSLHRATFYFEVSETFLNMFKLNTNTCILIKLNHSNVVFILYWRFKFEKILLALLLSFSNVIDIQQSGAKTIRLCQLSHLEDILCPIFERFFLTAQLVSLRHLVDPLAAQLSEDLVDITGERTEVRVRFRSETKHAIPEIRRRLKTTPTSFQS